MGLGEEILYLDLLLGDLATVFQKLFGVVDVVRV